MSAAALLAEIGLADGKIWMDGDRLKFRAVPARLTPLIREHKAELLALLSEQTGKCSTAPVSVRPEDKNARFRELSLSVRHSADMAPQSAPATVTCGSCVRFQPGTTSLGIGVCLATTNGLPPKEQRGYLAAYPMAPRQCRDFDFQPTKEIQHG